MESETEKTVCIRSLLLLFTCFERAWEKNSLKVSTPKGSLQHNPGSLPGLQFPGWKLFPLESCKMLVTDEIGMKSSCFPEHQGGLLPCNALGEMLCSVSARWLMETLTWLWARRQVSGWPSHTPVHDSRPNEEVSRSRRLEESESYVCQTALGQTLFGVEGTLQYSTRVCEKPWGTLRQGDCKPWKECVKPSLWATS